MSVSMPPRSLSPISGESPLHRYLGVAAIAAAIDLLTKEAAVRSLGEYGLYTLTDRFSLTVVWNLGAAGGTVVGPFAWLLNVVVSVLALGLVLSVVRPMAAVDPRSTVALGLVSGGALGNLASIVAGPKGVADFLAVRLTQNVTMVANVADLFLWSGALMLIPVAITVLRMARAERGAKGVPARARMA